MNLQGARTALVIATLAIDPTVTLVTGHGYMSSPRSRNFYAHSIINTIECTSPDGCPPQEYCHHCLNNNDGVCGKSPGGANYETSLWKDREGNPMPWRAQGPGGTLAVGGEYVEGGTMVVDSILSTHHNGHMELRACVMDSSNATKCSTFDDFEGNELHFVQDLVPEENHPSMYPDPVFPERGMYAGGQAGAIQSFSFVYRIPEGIYGERVLLQWKYITANSCSPPGYADYFANHTDLPDSYWTVGLTSCTPPYPNDGSRSTTYPEQFFNCAEVSILPSASLPPTVSPKPTGAPTTASPTESKVPTSAPIVGPPRRETCLAAFEDCTYDWQDGCCSGTGYKCTQVDAAGYGRCLRDTCESGPSPAPGGEGGCCSVNLGTCNHPEGSYCDNEANCEGDVETGGCGKVWLPDGPLEGCLPLWVSGCVTDADCCQHGECRSGTCDSDDPWKKSPPSPTTAPTTPAPTSSPTPAPTDAPVPPQPTASPVTPSPTRPPTPAPTEDPTAPAPTGNPTTPSPHGAAFDGDYSDKVRVNQVGYLRFATKIGVVVDPATSPLDFQIHDASGTVVSSGVTTVFGDDDASGDHVHQADFTSVQNLGSYKLVVDGVGASLEFQVAPSLYPDLPHEAMNYFYFHRMGDLEIEAEHLIDERYARAALHPDDAAVPAYPGWCETCDDFDLQGSWADAGDYGIYTVIHAISAWTLLNLHEMFPGAFGDDTLNLPESGNGFPDVLDEVDFGSRFVRGMLPSDGGLASHKAHNHAWSAFTITIEGENGENAAGTRSVMASSTPATYAVARVNAQLARAWSSRGGDAAHVDALWSAAKDAWSRAGSFPDKPYNAGEASPGPAVGGGDYPDGQTSDDRYAAACEMYLTSHALGDEDEEAFKLAATGHEKFSQMNQWDWATVTGAGTLSLYAANSSLSDADMHWIEENIVSFAEQIKVAIDSEGYPSNLNYPSEFSKYPWGSNSHILNRMIALAYAYEITGEDSYQLYLLRSLDYIMGTNAMDISYVTGYGAKAETDTHDRWAWTIGQDAFWPRGWLSGGPNNELINDYETPGGVAAAKSYAGPGTAPHAWGSKENTINWNAPLAWVAWYVEHKIAPRLGGCDGNCPPQAQSLSAKVQVDTPIALTLSASDYDGAVTAWDIVDFPRNGTLSGTPPDLVYAPSTGFVGADSFAFRVGDDSGEFSNVASVSLVVQDCNALDLFEVPSAYPFFTGSYKYVHVSEDGPNLDNMDDPAHDVQWTESGLHQFSLRQTVDPHYSNLSPSTCMTNQAFSGPDASFTLSGCDIGGIDGDYWITNRDGNEIWVERNRGWAIVFTNDANYTPEFCRTEEHRSGGGPTTGSPTKAPSHSPTKAPVTPSPTGNGNGTPSPTSPPTNEPTNDPTPSPTPDPASGGGTTCCYNRNSGYQECDTNLSCSTGESECDQCGGLILSGPLVRDGCCFDGWNDCANIDPGTNKGCQYRKEDCEGSCGGTWQLFDLGAGANLAGEELGF